MFMSQNPWMTFQEKTPLPAWPPSVEKTRTSAVLMPFDAIYHEKKRRHIGAYLRFFHEKKEAAERKSRRS